MSTVETAINTLIGEDADKSVRDIAIEELVNQLVAPGAAENLNGRVYVDMTMTPFVAGAIYVETDSPIRVVQIQ